MTNRLSHDRMADELDKLVYGKLCWLSDFSQGPKKRSETEIELKRIELAVLRQAASDYRAAHTRKGEAA